MNKHQRNPVLSLAKTRRGFELSVDNAIRLVSASSVLMKEFPDKSLALSQLAQEEVGKSLSLLAAIALPPNSESWRWLWDEWRDHELKAHRAYLYEIIHPLRIEVPHLEGGEDHDGGPLLERLPHEKEVGFYVEFDREMQIFVSPQEQVDTFAAVARMTTAAYLGARRTQ